MSKERRRGEGCDASNGVITAAGGLVKPSGVARPSLALAGWAALTFRHLCQSQPSASFSDVRGISYASQVNCPGKALPDQGFSLQR